MDPQNQALIAALMGGQNSAMPSQIAQMPQAQQFNPQALGYGGQSPQGQPGMFGQPQQMPYGAQASMNMQPQNMMS